MKILVAGGAGYIGSHTIIELSKKGYEIVCVDNLYNSKIKVIENIEKIIRKKIQFYKVDCCNKRKLDTIFEKETPNVVIMFQGYKAVGESVAKPLYYFRNNIDSALTILELMEKHNVHNVIFSSSATVYGINAKSPIKETDVALRLDKISSPYGASKAMIERILLDKSKADKNFKSVILRYFNPVGAHESALIGEDPNGLPNNLMPYISKVATCKLPYLKVFGNDYKTKDGTGVRDYIHVVDLAKGHVAALKCFKNKKINYFVYNLGTGKGTTVLELVKAYEKANEKTVKYVITKRRDGDVDKLYCSPNKAKNELNWEAKLDIVDMCKTSFNYENNN